MDLALVWFLIVAGMLAAYLVLDGFDFGVGMAMPLLAKDDADRRQMINAIAPVWDLNETWLIIGGAALFAAFPEWYATMFSGFYIPLLLILLALIVRAVAFEYRHQRPDTAWRSGFDWCIILGSAIPAFLWGVAFANIAAGVPMEPNGPGALVTDGLFALLNPYALLGGVAVAALCLTHGVIFTALKTTGELRARAVKLAKLLVPIVIVGGAAFLGWTVLQAPHVLTVAVAAIAAVALVVAWLAVTRDREGVAFAATAVAIATAAGTLFASLAVREGGPYVMPASNPSGDFVGLTVANASSSDMTLQVMTWAAVICLPVIAVYQVWSYWVFRKRITRDVVEAAHA